jgi:hypothetical protein
VTIAVGTDDPFLLPELFGHLRHLRPPGRDEVCLQHLRPARAGAGPATIGFPAAERDAALRSCRRTWPVTAPSPVGYCRWRQRADSSRRVRPMAPDVRPPAVNSTASGADR